MEGLGQKREEEGVASIDGIDGIDVDVFFRRRHRERTKNTFHREREGCGRFPRGKVGQW
jgi:hypothetical protein